MGDNNNDVDMIACTKPTSSIGICHEAKRFYTFEITDICADVQSIPKRYSKDKNFIHFSK